MKILEAILKFLVLLVIIYVLVVIAMVILAFLAGTIVVVWRDVFGFVLSLL